MGAIIALASGVTGLLLMFAAWITHVIVSIQTASWVLLIVGAFFFPIGIIHGAGSWFGLF